MRHPPKQHVSKVGKKSDKALREDLIAAQFAPHAERLRRVSYKYMTRPVATSGDGEEGHVMHEHVSTDSFSPMKQIDALIAFAEDFDISPLMLLESEVRKAVVETHKRKVENLHKAVGNDRIFVDFITVCSEMIAEKRPFRNIMGKYSDAEKVAALLAFLCLDQKHYLDDILSARFSCLNDMYLTQVTKGQEMEKEKDEQRQTEDFAKQGLRGMWEQVQQIFLYFCKRPDAPSNSLPKDPVLPVSDPQPLTAAEDRAAEVIQEVTEETHAHHIHVLQRRLAFGRKHDRKRDMTLKIFQAATGRIKNAVKEHKRRVGKADEQVKEAVADESEVATSVGGGQSLDAEIVQEVERLMMPLDVLAGMPSKARSSVRCSTILFGGGGIDPDTGGLPGSVVADLLEETWEDWGQGGVVKSIHQMRKSEGVGNIHLDTTVSSSHAEDGSPPDDSRDSPDRSLPITLPLPELLRWKYANVDDMTPLPTPPVSPLPPSRARPITASAGRQQLRSGGQAKMQSTKQSGHINFFGAAAASGHVGRPKTAAPRQRLWGLKAAGSKSSAPPSFPARIVLNDRDTTHLIRPKLETSSSVVEEKSRLPGKKLDLRTINWNIENSLFQERGGQWTDVPEAGFTRLTLKDQVLQERVINSWKQGPTRHDSIFERAARKIQSSARKYIARKMMKSGLYMQEARAGWLEANPSKPLWSHEASISLGDLLTLARIFSIIPKVVCESELVDMAIVLIKEANRKRRRKQSKDQDFSLTWKIFQELCVKLAERFAIQKTNMDKSDDGSHNVGFGALFDLFSVMLENSGNPYNPHNPREWVRSSITIFSKKERMEQPNVSKTSSTKFDSIKIHSDAATVGGDKEWQKESFRQSPRIGPVEARHYMSSCTQHGVGPEPCIIDQLSKAEINVAHYDLQGRKLLAFFDVVKNSTSITSLNMSDARLDQFGVECLCGALKSNSSIITLNISENYIEEKGVQALAQMIAMTNGLKTLNLSGVGMTDAMFDTIYREGMEKNSTIENWDMSYNLLSDQSLLHLEHWILEKTCLERLDLSWNLFSVAGVNSMTMTNTERSKPRARLHGIGGFTKALNKLNFIINPSAQRHHLASWMSLNGQVQVSVEQTVMPQTDFITMDIALRIRKLTDIQRCLLIRLYTENKYLTVDMAKQLLTFFLESENTIKTIAFDIISCKVPESTRHEIEDLSSFQVGKTSDDAGD